MAKATTPEPGNPASASLAAKGESEGKTSESPFLLMPREVRDKIYDELLINRLTPENQEKYDQVKAAKETPCGEFGRDNALDYLADDILLMPGANKGYPFIMDAMGLLLANKQINEEATETLFSKNTFLILVEWARVFTFWRCENKGCGRVERPCFVTLRDFKRIKHLAIHVRNLRGLNDPKIGVESNNLMMNLRTVVVCLLQGGNKLKSLAIRYTSCFQGQIESVRNNLEGELEEGMPETLTMLKDMYGKIHPVSRQETHKLFRYCQLLTPLYKLKGIAENVKIRGDLPQSLIDELIDTLSVPVEQLGAVTKKKRQEVEAERMKRKESEKMAGSDFHRSMKEMAEKYAGTETEQFYRDALKMPVKSPAIVEELMRPPTWEEMLRFEMRGRTQEEIDPYQSSNGSEDEWEEYEDEDEDEGSHVDEGIGLIDGKVVFGPPRPPGML